MIRSVHPWEYSHQTGAWLNTNKPAELNSGHIDWHAANLCGSCRVGELRGRFPVRILQVAVQGSGDHARQRCQGRGCRCLGRALLSLSVPSVSPAAMVIVTVLTAHTLFSPRHLPSLSTKRLNGVPFGCEGKGINEWWVVIFAITTTSKCSSKPLSACICNFASHPHAMPCPLETYLMLVAVLQPDARAKWIVTHQPVACHFSSHLCEILPICNEDCRLLNCVACT